MYDELERF